MRSRKILIVILFTLTLILFGICVHFLVDYRRDVAQESNLQQTLSEIYWGTDGLSPDNAAEIDVPSYQGESLVTEEDTAAAAVSEGLLTLHTMNPDCIGWLTIEGTSIDYPVMYHPEEEEYYLHRDFYGGYRKSGSLYVSEICDLDDYDNLIIYGHHMSSGSMFAELDAYKQESFYQEHPNIVFDTLHGTELYEVCAVFVTPVYTGNDFAYYAFTKAADEEEFNTFMAEVAARSLYDTGVSASYGDKLLTLSTCEYSRTNGRVVVVAKRIENTEVLTNE